LRNPHSSEPVIVDPLVQKEILAVGIPEDPKLLLARSLVLDAARVITYHILSKPAFLGHDENRNLRQHPGNARQIPVGLEL
jgi:hypothetical protein